MTPEQMARLHEKKWLNRANSLRQEMRNVIAPVLHKSPAEIQFTDFALTKEIRGRFAEELNGKREVIVPNRSAAIDLVRTRLENVYRPAFLLHNGYDESGMIQLNVNEAITCIDGILKSQGEYFGIISQDGVIGACVTVEEGIAAHYPRCVILWNNDRNEANN